MKRISWNPEARANLRKADQQTAMQILKTIHRYAESEAGDVKKLKTPLSSLRLRAGDWRVLFTEPDPSTMRITGVYHRSQAYRG